VAIAIVGAGSWGTALATIAAHNVEVILYTRDKERAIEMNSSRTNERYLSDIDLNDRIRITSDVNDVNGIDSLVIAVPSIAFREAVEKFAHLDIEIPYVSVTKGLERNTNYRMSQVVSDADPKRTLENFAVLGGPNLAAEIAQGEPAATVIASTNTEVASSVQKVFLTKKFRAYITDDVVGCEIAGVAKNVVAIAVGIGDGLGYGDNAKAAVMTRGLAEISRLGQAEGGKKETFSGLAGLGDLIATCSSSLSRNRTVGYQLGKGKTLAEIKETSSDIAEGVYSVEALLARGKELGVEMPIAEGVAKVVQDGKLSPDAVDALMSRPAGRE